MKKQISALLQTWYTKNKRDLPWRRTRDVYSIWLSEIMLQQTTVRAVIPYFEAFLKKFPTVQDLARAKEETVLSMWSGLGYYSRARNLHAAAKQVTHLGSFPSSYEELKKLKGVGPYTAAAVASIAYDEEVPVVDGNVIRVITRLFDISTDIKLKTTQDLIKSYAKDLISKQKPSDFNQAMMELGATVCTPKNPACVACPVVKSCKSIKAGTVLQRPVKTKNKKQEPWLWEIQLYKKGNRFALVKNENGTPWLKNSWVFPGLAKKLAKPLDSWDFKHSITHHNIFVQIVAKKTSLKWPYLKWVTSNDVEKLGVSSIVKKALTTEKLKAFLKG